MAEYNYTIEREVIDLEYLKFEETIRLNLGGRLISVKEFEHYFNTEFHKITNPELIILKGHTITEYLLNTVITHCCKQTEPFPLKDFSYTRKVHIYRMLFNVYGLAGKNCFDQLVAFNNLRNSIAHNLVYDEEKLKYLIKISHLVGSELSKLGVKIPSIKHAVSIIIISMLADLTRIMHAIYKRSIESAFDQQNTERKLVFVLKTYIEQEIDAKDQP